jgi:hypothetical protein
LAIEEEGLPTRQEAQEQTWSDGPEYHDENELAAGYEDNPNTLADEEAGISTRQEAGQRTWGESADEPSADAQRGMDAGSGIADDGSEHDVENASSEQVTLQDQYGHDVPVTVVRVDAEDRTLGDDTPTGIGRKPTGEELLGMKGDQDKESRMDRLFGDLFAHADDVKDASENTTQTIEAFRHPDSSAPASASAHAGYQVWEAPPEDSHVQDIVGSVAITSVAAVVGVRHWWTGRRREHTGR